MTLNDFQKAHIRNEVQREIFKKSFFDFVKWAAELLEPSTKWDWNFHHEYLCKILEKETHRIYRGEPKGKNLIINVPFRSSKSLICSICYPIWSWMISPDIPFINLSYSADLSTDHSNKVVSILNHPRFQELFPWEFDETQRGKTDFKLKNGALRLSGGMTGTVLGRGGQIIIMDDPNNTKRLSAVERHNTIKSWKDTVNTRLNDPLIGLFIVIQQRLHREDLTGYLLENEPDNWFNICLPAELSPKITPPQLAEFYSNGLLWEKRFTPEVLNNFKLVLGSIGYANQLQQETSPPEGNIIKRDWIETISYEKFNYITSQSSPKWELFLDTAFTSKQSNDASSILVACKFNNNVYIRKAFEVRLEFPELITKIKEIYGLYCNPSSRVFVELKASGHDIFNTLKRQTSLIMVALPTPKDDKGTRLNAVSPLIEGGRLILIEDVSNDVVIDQLTGFPNVAHDDVMDTVVYALQKYVGRNTDLNYMML